MTQDLSFHEATVLELTREGDTARLELQDIRIGERFADATVFVDGVETITIDDQPVAALEKEYEDGEVLTLEIGERHILLVVEWNDFARRLSQTRGLEIHGQSVRVMTSEPREEMSHS